jgi:hypothetical protein
MPASFLRSKARASRSISVRARIGGLQAIHPVGAELIKDRMHRGLGGTPTSRHDLKQDLICRLFGGFFDTDALPTSPSPDDGWPSLNV